MNKIRCFALLFVILFAVAGIGAGKEGATGTGDKVRMQVQSGHNDRALVLAWSPDGKILATGSSDTTVRLWSNNGRLLKVLEGHRGSVFTISWNPDGKTLASGSDDKTVRLWGNDGRLLKVFEGHGHWVTTISWSPDGKMLASGSGGTIHLWSSEGHLLKVLEGHDEGVTTLSWSPDGKMLASGSADKTVRLWIDNGRLVKVLEGHGLRVSSLSWSPNGKMLASGSWDKTVRLWSNDGRLIKVLEGHSLIIDTISWSPDGKILTSGSRDGTIRFWNCDGLLLKILVGHSNWIIDLSWSPDGKTLASGSADKTVCLWKKDGVLLKVLDGYSYCVKNVSWSPDGMTLASGSEDGTVHLWNNYGRLLKVLEGNNDFVTTLSWSPDGKMLASISGSKYYTVRLWNKDGRLVKVLGEHGDSVTTILWNPDGKIVVTGSKDNSIHLWNIDGRLLKVFEGHGHWVTTLCWSPNGKILASRSEDDNTIKFWNSDGSLLRVLRGYGSPVMTLLWSPDGNTLAAGTWNGNVCLWSSEGHLMKVLEGNNDFVTTLSWSPNGKMLASGSGDSIHLWSSEGHLVKVLEGHRNRIIKLLWCPDGKTLVSGSGYTIRLWSSDGRLLKVMDDQNYNILSLSWSPDGKILASGSEDENTIYLWSRNGRLLRVLEGHSYRVYTLSWSPDGKTLASGSMDSTIRFWNPSTGDSIAVLAFDSGDWIHYTPDYYYRLTGDATNAIAFVKDKEMKAYGFDQFDLRYNRPDIVLSRLYPEKDRPDHIQARIDRYRKYWEYRVARNGFTTDQVSGKTSIHAPEVFDIKLNGLPLNVSMEEKKKGVKEADIQLSDRTATISFRIQDEKGSNLNIIGYKIFVNGVPVHGQYIKRFDTPRKIQEVSESIMLSSVPDIRQNPGDNKIEISGFTEDGVESNREVVYVTYTGADKKTKGNLYIVSLGVNDYSKAKGLESLTYAVGDAKDIVRTFTSAGKGMDDRPREFLYTDSQVTRDTVKSIRQELAKTTVDDTVIFFMAGHGVRADTAKSAAVKMQKEFGIASEIGDISAEKEQINVYYYMTGDSDAAQPWDRAIPMDAIRQALDGIPARQKVLMVDTCQSGEKIELAGYTPSKERIEEIRKKRGGLTAKAANRGVKLVHRGVEVDPVKLDKLEAMNGEVREMSEMFPELRRGTGTIEISAATGVQSALESAEWKNGAFTYVVKEAVLGGKAKNKDGKITAKSLRSFVLGEVERLTNGRQTPMVCRDIAGRDFVIGE